MIQPKILPSNMKWQFSSFSITKARITLIAWASTVAIAAPAASICKPATNTKSPIMLTTHAIATNINGDLLSQNPRNMADNTL